MTDVSQFWKLFTGLDTQKADSAVCTSLSVATSVAFWLAGSAALEGDASNRGFHTTAGSASVRAEDSFAAAFGPKAAFVPPTTLVSESMVRKFTANGEAERRSDSAGRVGEGSWEGCVPCDALLALVPSGGPAALEGGFRIVGFGSGRV